MNDLIGIPFDPDNKNGINCHELLRKAFKKFNINVPPTDIAVCASKAVSNKEIKSRIKLQWDRVDIPEVPCGVLILSSNNQFADHIATYIGNNQILHVSKNTNSVIENIYPKFRTRIVGFYKFTGDKKDK